MAFDARLKLANLITKTNLDFELKKIVIESLQIKQNICLLKMD